MADETSTYHNCKPYTYGIKLAVMILNKGVNFNQYNRNHSKESMLGVS